MSGYLASKRRFWRFILTGVVSIAFIFTDIHTDILEQIRKFGVSLVYPMEVVGKVPIEIVAWFEEVTKDENQVIAENNYLKQQIIELQLQTLEIASIRKENEYLTRMLETSKTYANWKSQVARVTHIPNSAFHRYIDIDKGEKNQISKGDAVLFDNVVIGQVKYVNPTSSRVILISDPEHKTPIESQRTGLSGILNGNSGKHLPVMYMRNYSDIKEGDLLVTSGKGNVFPKNIPVARVENVEFAKGHNFARVRANRIVDISMLNYVVILSNNK